MIAAIPVLNESETIGALVSSLARFGLDVVVVDGGSTDQTCAEALDAGATLFSGSEGIGPCLMTAWRYALRQGRGLLQIDAGGSHDPSDYLAMRGLIDDGVDIVIGSRFLPASEYICPQRQWWRPFLSRTAALAMNYAQSGAHYTDWTSGYRYFSRQALEKLLSRKYMATMHGWQVEVLAYAGEMGLRIAESPIHYTLGRSSFNGNVARELFKTWWNVLHHVGWVGSRLNEELS